jgi:hypothetical protein
LRFREAGQRKRLIPHWLSAVPQFHWQKTQFFQGPGAQHSSGRNFTQRNPVVSPPTEGAAHRAQRKKAKEAIERTQFGWSELDGVATRAFAPYQ